MGDALRLALVAGETSGDLLAGLLLGGVKQRWPAVHSAGIGGPQMQAQGFEAWWPSEKLAVRGYVEVLRHYREIIGIRRQLQARLLHDTRPDLFIGVDAPDFNLDLEAGLKAAGIPTVHFVCPSIWAWRPERIEKIRRSVRDPAVAELLCPKDHPFASKRLCVDTDYYATYNRPNVTLVDRRATPIEEITQAGIRTSAREFAPPLGSAMAPP